MLGETNVIFFALLGGIVPAFFWLWFWIREDRLRPEPKLALLSSFAGGILAVLISLFLELVFYYLLADCNPYHINGFPDILRLPLQALADKYDLLAIQTHFWERVQGLFDGWNFSVLNNIDVKRFFLVVILAPIIEELLKLIATYNICLRRKVNDEPIDASIYLLTAALGFAAIETAIFLTDPLTKGNIVDGLVAGNFRFIGPMLIHLVSSAMLGLFMGLAFYKSRIKKLLYSMLGLIIAIILHSIFNFFITLNDATHNTIFFWIACLGTWLLVIVLLVFFERVKKIIHFSLKKDSPVFNGILARKI